MGFLKYFIFGLVVEKVLLSIGVEISSRSVINNLYEI